MTEITDRNVERAAGRLPLARGRLFYDGTCSFCIGWVNRIRRLLARRGIEAVPFENGGQESEMKLVLSDGRDFGGADAAIFLAGKIWWAWPLRAIAIVPGVKPIMRAVYRRIAATRHCRSGACALPVSPPNGTGVAGWGVLVFFVALAWLAGTPLMIQPCWVGDLTLLNRGLPPWLWMWMLAGAMWAGFKWMAWSRAGGWPAVGGRTFAYSAWIGMDAAAFRKRGPARNTPWLGGVIFAIVGGLLLWVLIPAIEHPILRGWLGMIGLLFLMHFGLFEVLAAFWNRHGFHVAPIMDAPWRAGSLTEFWSDRWNRGFSDVGRVAVFRPLVRRFGIGIGTLAGFLFSGLAHELVISVPAGAGYGLPTAYFLTQGLGVLAERRLEIRGRKSARVWTFLFVLGPAFWLFHPPFMTRVISPFLEAITF